MGNSDRSSYGIKGEAVGLGRELYLGAHVEEGKVTRDEVVGDASGDVLFNALMRNELDDKRRGHIQERQSAH